MKEKILDLLRKKNNGYVSGEEISVKLNVSRMAVSKTVKKLKEEGYDISAVTHKGYRLVSRPDKPFGHEIKIGLGTRSLGRKDIFYYESVGSTNDEAYSVAEKGAPEGTVVISESQTRGKGRMGRKWESPTGGGVYMSVVLRPDVPIDQVPTITLVAALSVVNAIKKVSGITAGIKWPNDIMYNDKKLCGILTEIKAQPDKVDFLIVGIGINVNSKIKDLPDVATSIKEGTGKAVDRVLLVKSILSELENDYEIFQKKGFGALRDECKKFSLVLNKSVKITVHHKVTTGTAVDIDEKGALIVEDDRGKAQRVFSGDVVLAH